MYLAPLLRVDKKSEPFASHQRPQRPAITDIEQTWPQKDSCIQPLRSSTTEMCRSMRARSMDEAARIAAHSAAAIDAFHQASKRDTWMEVKRLELLMDLKARAG